MKMVSGLRKGATYTLPCALCGEPGPAAVTKPARICWGCWREMGVRRRKEIRNATAQ